MFINDSFRHSYKDLCLKLYIVWSSFKNRPTSYCQSALAWHQRVLRLEAARRNLEYRVSSISRTRVRNQRVKCFTAVFSVIILRQGITALVRGFLVKVSVFKVIVWEGKPSFKYSLIQITIFYTWHSQIPSSNLRSTLSMVRLQSPRPSPRISYLPVNSPTGWNKYYL